MDITDFYYGNYDAFTKEFVTMKRLRQIRPKKPYFCGKIAQNQEYLITDITEYYKILQNFIITEYYGKLRSEIISTGSSHRL